MDIFHLSFLERCTSATRCFASEEYKWIYECNIKHEFCCTQDKFVMLTLTFYKGLIEIFFEEGHPCYFSILSKNYYSK